MLGASSRHSRLRRTAAVVTGLAATAAYTFAVAPGVAHADSTAAATPTVTGITLSATQPKVKTSTHHHVKVALTAYSYAGGGDLNIELSTKAESHSWDFPVPQSALSVNSSGKGTLKPKASATQPLAKVALSFKPTGSATVQKCKGVVESKTRKVSISGTFWMDTQSGKHGWGTAGSKKKTFHFTSRPTIVWEYDTGGVYCETPPPTPCLSGGSWNISGGTQVNIYGNLNSKRVTATRYVTLHKPKGVDRTDNITTTLKKVHFTRHGNTTAKLVLTGNKKKGTTGSGTITGKTAVTGTGLCGKNASGKASYTYWKTTKYAHGKPPLRVHDIYGAMTGKNGSADLSVTKVTKKPSKG